MPGAPRTDPYSENYSIRLLPRIDDQPLIWVRVLYLHFGYPRVHDARKSFPCEPLAFALAASAQRPKPQPAYMLAERTSTSTKGQCRSQRTLESEEPEMGALPPGQTHLNSKHFRFVRFHYGLRGRVSCSCSCSCSLSSEAMARRRPVLFFGAPGLLQTELRIAIIKFLAPRTSAGAQSHLFFSITMTSTSTRQRQSGV